MCMESEDRVESKYGVSGTITTQWLLGGTVVGVPRDLSRDLWVWSMRSHDPWRSHETCHVTCGHGPTRWHKKKGAANPMLCNACYSLDD